MPTTARDVYNALLRTLEDEYADGAQRQERGGGAWGGPGAEVKRAVAYARDGVRQPESGESADAYRAALIAQIEAEQRRYREFEDDIDGYGSATFAAILRSLGAVTVSRHGSESVGSPDEWPDEWPGESPDERQPPPTNAVLVPGWMFSLNAQVGLFSAALLLVFARELAAVPGFVLIALAGLNLAVLLTALWGHARQAFWPGRARRLLAFHLAVFVSTGVLFVFAAFSSGRALDALDTVEAVLLSLGASLVLYSGVLAVWLLRAPRRHNL